MKKAELKALAERYSMEIMRNPITDEAFGVMCESEDLIPELDEIADSLDRMAPCTGVRELIAGTTYRYKIIATPAWFDRWGWAEKNEEAE